MPESSLKALFPTPFLHVVEAIDRQLVMGLMAHARRGKKESNRHTELLSHTEVADPQSQGIYRELAEAVQPSMRSFGTALFGEDLEWKIKEMWTNVLKKGGHQALHSHANSFISGVVYLTKSHPGSNTVFYRGLGGRDFTFSNDHKDAEPNQFNAQKWALQEVEPGDMVLFPSYIYHEVPTNQGDRRVSVAFNAVPARLKSHDYELSFE